MAAFKKGDSVRQIVKPIEGEVKRFALDQESGTISYVIGWTDETGEHEVSLTGEQLELAPAKAPVDAETTKE